ncbi:MAG: trypsin-like peptidase domain-containing protein [Acidobacteriota bacterium]
MTPLTRNLIIAAGSSLLGLQAWAATNTQAPATVPVARTALQQLAETVRPSVVEIIGTVAGSGDTSYGSGFILREPSLVLTNAHVVRGIENLRVHTWEGASLASVDVLLIESDIDLAVIRVTGLKAPPLAEGVRTLPPVGTPVVAVGHPRGYEFTVSEGIVSATRQLDEGGVTMIQMTTPISPGSSGGPLLDMQGQVVGVCSLTLAEGQNINFAIPVSELPPVIDKALKIERALRAPSDSSMPIEAIALLIHKQRERGDLQSASQLAERALRTHPQSVPLLVEAAETAFARGSLQEASAAIERILRIAPRNAAALQIGAAVMAEQGNCDAAVRQAQAALDVGGLDDTQIGEAHALLGECLGRQGLPQEALAHIDAALTSAAVAKLPDYHALRAFLLQSLGRLDDADEAAVTALTRAEWDPVVVAALRERGLPRLTEIVTFKSTHDGTETTVVGVVKNRGPVALEELSVTAEGLGKSGTIVATGTANAIPKKLVPGATGSFKIVLQGLVDEIADLRVRVVDFKEP